MKRHYKIPDEITHVKRLRSEAHARRRVLRQAGLTTYTIGLKSGARAIVCLCCGLGSSNPRDAIELYCGFCRQFHNDIPKEESNG